MPGSRDLSCNLADADPAVIAPDDALQSTVANSEQDSSYADACIYHWIDRAVGLVPNGRRIVLAGDGRGNLLLGGPGNDTLIAGHENDVPVGGSSADMFLFDAQIGQDTILDFNGQSGDRILVDASLTWTVESNSLPGMTIRFCDGAGCCSQAYRRPGSTHTDPA